MGRTTKPLTLLVTDPEMLQWEGIIKLISQKHTVMTLNQWGDTVDRPEVDGVLGPDAWYIDKQHAPYFKNAIEAFRAKKYPNRKKEED
jgi:hypothetical protein